MALAVLSCVAIAYLSGSLPWGLWIGRFARGVDIRTLGSGNLGATNVYRSLGPGLGVLTLLLDIAKGALPVWLLPHAAFAAAFPGGPEWCGLAVGFAAVAGHVWTFLAGFKGGKGVATTAGVLLALAPAAFGVFVAGLPAGRGGDALHLARLDAGGGRLRGGARPARARRASQSHVPAGSAARAPRGVQAPRQLPPAAAWRGAAFLVPGRTDLVSTVAVLGAGSWGTTLAVHLCEAGAQVRLWGNVREDLDAMIRVAGEPEVFAWHPAPRWG